MLEVAHRLGSIADCDRVVVMEAGRVVEQGSPQALREDPTSAFARMAAQQERQQRHRGHC